MGIHKLRGLEYLVAVVDCRSFSAAARHLGVASPSVHRLVRAQEAEPGVALLEHAALPLRPSPDGVGDGERARSLPTELRELDASVRDQSHAPRGATSVAADSSVREYLLPGLLAPFRERFPDIAVQVLEAGSTRDPARLGTDLLMQSRWPPPQEAALRTLAETRRWVVATPAYWARQRQPQQPAVLAHRRCDRYRTPFGEVLNQWTFRRAGRTESSRSTVASGATVAACSTGRCWSGR